MSKKQQTFNRCRCKRIIVWVIMMILLDYVSASTEVSKIDNGQKNSLERLSKNIIGTILQYLNVVDYLRFKQAGRNQYQKDPEKIIKLVCAQYQSYLITPKITNFAEIAMWGRYADIIRSCFWYKIDVSQYVSPEQFIFFTPSTISPPKIMCKSIKKEDLRKEIEIFFKPHRKTFAIEKVKVHNHNIVAYRPILNSMLPVFYNPRHAFFCSWNYKYHEIRSHKIVLPYVMVFTKSNCENTSIQIEQISNCVSKGIQVNFEEKNTILSWFSITLKTFLHMVFDPESGFLDKIITQKGKEDQIPHGSEDQGPCGDQIHFKLIDKETCKYTIEDASQKNKAGFTTITVYYFKTKHVHHPSKLKAYAHFICNYHKRHTKQKLYNLQLEQKNLRKKMIEELRVEYENLKGKKIEEEEELEWKHFQNKKMKNFELEYENSHKKMIKDLRSELKNVKRKRTKDLKFFD